MRRHLPRSILAVALVGVLPTLASAQPTLESAGERALGMGGAFVAVADDATAAHWNPAGLATAGPAGMTIGWNRFQLGNSDDPVRAGAFRRGGNYTSFGTWPIGVSYGRYTITDVRDLPGGGLGVETLRTTQIGVTVLQSLVTGLVVGSSLRYLRGEVVAATVEGGTIEEAFSRTDDLDASRTSAFDFDVGVMADMQRVRVGVTWKNLRTPTFGENAAVQMTLPRQTRLGLAILPVDGLTLAMDLDLETVDLRGDLRRVFALGGEGQIGGRLAVRSGVRWSLEGSRRVLASAGVSVSLRPGVWLDGHYTQSHEDEGREVGVALRAGL